MANLTVGPPLVEIVRDAPVEPRLQNRERWGPGEPMRTFQIRVTTRWFAPRDRKHPLRRRWGADQHTGNLLAEFFTEGGARSWCSGEGLETPAEVRVIQ